LNAGELSDSGCDRGGKALIAATAAARKSNLSVKFPFAEM
jgi:hypothetical protein